VVQEAQESLLEQQAEEETHLQAPVAEEAGISQAYFLQAAAEVESVDSAEEENLTLLISCQRKDKRGTNADRQCARIQQEDGKMTSAPPFRPLLPRWQRGSQDLVRGEGRTLTQKPAVTNDLTVGNETQIQSGVLVIQNR
jgi:hypothetical protein